LTLGVPALYPPAGDVHASFLVAMAEFQAEGRGVVDDTSMLGSEIREYGPTWADPVTFDRYTKRLRAQALPETPRPAGYVPCTTLWWVDGDEYLGRIAIRHQLTEFLREVGGHIGYDVRPSARRRGHATAMLRAARPVAHRLGIEQVLVTCDWNNVGSRKAIEANGGVYEDQRADKLRYWVPTFP
jgi:predicted acetyltransferase